MASAAAVFGSPSRVAPDPMPVDSVDSAGAQHAPRSLDFGYATTAPTARVGEGRGAKLLPADASLADVASYLIFVGTNIDTHAL